MQREKSKGEGKTTEREEFIKSMNKLEIKMLVLFRKTEKQDHPLPKFVRPGIKKIAIS